LPRIVSWVRGLRTGGEPSSLRRRFPPLRADPKPVAECLEDLPVAPDLGNDAGELAGVLSDKDLGQGLPEVGEEGGDPARGRPDLRDEFVDGDDAIVEREVVDVEGEAVAVSGSLEGQDPGDETLDHSESGLLPENGAGGLAAPVEQAGDDVSPVRVRRERLE
jgi:hypothetical protein